MANPFEGRVERFRLRPREPARLARDAGDPTVGHAAKPPVGGFDLLRGRLVRVRSSCGRAETQEEPPRSPLPSAAWCQAPPRRRARSSGFCRRIRHRRRRASRFPRRGFQRRRGAPRRARRPPPAIGEAVPRTGRDRRRCGRGEPPRTGARASSSARATAVGVRDRGLPPPAPPRRAGQFVPDVDTDAVARAVGSARNDAGHGVGNGECRTAGKDRRRRQDGAGEQSGAHHGSFARGTASSSSVGIWSVITRSLYFW